MEATKQRIGKTGEDIAINHLKYKGYQILDRNFRKKWGEIDIVAVKTKGLIFKKIESIVFVEVKTIKSEVPLEFAAKNIHFWKQKRLIRTAKTYLAQKRVPPEIPWQIDVILVQLDELTGLPKIEHLENAVWGR